MSAPAWIGKDTHQGPWSRTVRPPYRLERWPAGDIATTVGREGIFWSWYTSHPVERVARNRYVADDDGNLHCYDSDGRKVIVHPADRVLWILVRDRDV